MSNPAEIGKIIGRVTSYFIAPRTLKPTTAISVWAASPTSHESYTVSDLFIIVLSLGWSLCRRVTLFMALAIYERFDDQAKDQPPGIDTVHAFA